MSKAAFVIPGDLTLPTGGYAYDRNVLARLAAHGVEIEHVALPGGYPSPSVADLAETERRIAALPDDTVLLIDGLAYGAMPAETIALFKQKIVALVHHPLCLEAGLTPSRASALQACERRALSLAHCVVVTSPTTARTLVSEFAVPDSKITVAVPGTERARRARGTGAPLQLLAVGSIVPRKAYDVLIAALSKLSSSNWHLTIVGAVRDDGARAQLEAELDRAQAANAGFRGRVTITGSVDDVRLSDLYDRADLFVMPSLYEGFGMVLTEAMARGLPIVCTTGGAAAETVPDIAAIKVAPGDATAFGDAVATVLADATRRRRMADASWAAALTLPTWDDTARTIAMVLKRIAR